MLHRLALALCLLLISGANAASSGSRRGLKQAHRRMPTAWHAHSLHAAAGSGARSLQQAKKPIIIEPTNRLTTPNLVPSKFGDKVALNGDGKVLAVEAEWNSSASSAVFTTHRNGTGTSGPTYGAWHHVPEPPILSTYVPKPEFGTSIDLTLDGHQLLATIEDVTLNITANNLLPVGFVFRNTVGSTGPFKQHKGPLVIDISLSNPELVKLAATHPGGASLVLDTTIGQQSSDKRTIAITTQPKVEFAELPGVPEAEQEANVSIAGKVYVFHVQADNSYKLFQEIEEPGAPQAANSTFGKNSALSSNGLWLAVSEDTNATVYIFARTQQAQQFTLVTSVTGLFNATGGAAEVESLALSTDGSYLVVSYKMPTSETDPTKNETGAFNVYTRRLALPAPGFLNNSYHYTPDCVIETGVPNLDGVRMATSGHLIRVVLGFAGEEAQIWDIDMNGLGSTALCPAMPTFVVPASVNGTSLNNATDPENIQTVFESVAISGDGKTVALGAEAQNAVYIVTLPAIGSV